ncbi:hypothetical protein MASR2M78_16180 [Treponema sp.]
MDSTTEKTSRVKLSDRLVNFLQNNRKPLLIGVIVIVVGLIGTGIALTILENERNKAIVAVETLVLRYDEIRSEADPAKKDADELALIKDLEAFSSTHDSYAGARSLSVLASIRADRNEDSEAEAAYLAAAKMVGKSYLAPVSIYNAAVSAEDRGDADKALELYNRVIDEYGQSFPLLSRAYFALGRLQEANGELAAATASYKKLVELYPNDGWTKLANSRILSLNAQGAR